MNKPRDLYNSLRSIIVDTEPYAKRRLAAVAGCAAVAAACLFGFEQSNGHQEAGDRALACAEYVSAETAKSAPLPLDLDSMPSKIQEACGIDLNDATITVPSADESVAAAKEHYRQQSELPTGFAILGTLAGAGGVAITAFTPAHRPTK